MRDRHPGRDLEAEPDPGELKSEELDLLPNEQGGLRLGGDWAVKTRFGRLDVMQEVPGLRDYGHLRAGAIRVGGVLYAGYEELISMKAASGRDEDLRDIGALEAAPRRLTLRRMECGVAWRLVGGVRLRARNGALRARGERRRPSGKELLRDRGVDPAIRSRVRADGARPARCVPQHPPVVGRRATSREARLALLRRPNLPHRARG